MLSRGGSLGRTLRSGQYPGDEKHGKNEHPRLRCFPVCNPPHASHHSPMLRFSIFGFPVTVHWMFWVVIAILGGGLDSGNGPKQFQALLLWMVAAFISILIHELGHTF